MAVTKIHGARQIQDATIKNAQIASDAAIALSKLEEAVIQADGGQAFTGDQSMGGNKLTNVATPSAGTDAANKAYVDSVATGLDLKASVRAATTANITLSGAQTIDGVSVVAGDRVLVKNQSTASQNGIYVAANSTWSRATDADSDEEVTAGMFTFVTEGTTNGDTGWVLTTNDAITVGSTSLSFSQFTSAGAYTAGDGLSLTGSQFDVNAGNGIEIVSDAVTVKLDGSTLSKGSSGVKVARSATAGHIFMGKGSSADSEYVAMSGDATIDASGAVTVANTITRNAAFVDIETPSGSINGSNDSFTLAFTPVNGSVHLYLNGLLQEAGSGNDYTISGTTITMASPPLSGSKIRCSYRK